MGAIGRMIVSAGLIAAGSIGGFYWLYLLHFADPLVAQHASIWSDQWQLFQWSIPLACTVSIGAGCLYLVFGGVQRERKQEQLERRVR